LRFMKKWIKNNKDKHYDLIFAVSNPPVNSYVGLKLKKVFKAPFLYMNWDIYPQCIDYMIKNPLVHIGCKFWHRWNSKNYKKIDKMLTIGNVVAESINNDIKNKIDIDVIPIAVDTNRLKPIDKAENPFCEKHGLKDKFVVLYSGKMGYGHNIELILAAAERLKKNKDILFMFIGEGQKYELVKKAIKNQKESNINLLPFQPEDILPFSMASGDVGIVAEEKEMAHLFMPSKTYSMTACAMPVIGLCSENDDLQRLIENNELGFAVKDENVDTLCEAIEKLYNEKETLNRYKERARKCTEEKFAFSVVEENYKALFEKYL